MIYTVIGFCVGYSLAVTLYLYRVNRQLKYWQTLAIDFQKIGKEYCEEARDWQTRYNNTIKNVTNLKKLNILETVNQ